MSGDTDATDDTTATGTSVDTTMGSTVSMTTTTEPSTTEPSTTEPSTTAMTTTDPDSTTSAGLGPQIVMSVPADGSSDAPLDPYFFIYFDRIVSIDDAVGHIFVSQDGSAPQAISPMPCPPDADPTCIAGIFPESFSDPDSGALPSITEHVVTVEADFPDPDGMTNAADQTVTFTTFEYNTDFFDDSATIPGEFGGIVYSESEGALFLTGEAVGGGCVVRRIPLVDGAPQPASTAASPPGSQLCYGIDVGGDSLYVSGSYSDAVYRYLLGPGDLSASLAVIQDPPLAPPLDTLTEVWSVARAGNSLFFSTGQFLGGTEHASIFRSDPAWSEFTDGDNLWTGDDGVTMATASIGGVAVLFVLADQQLFRFRIADGVVEAQAEIEDLGYSTDLAVDSANRVYLGANNGIYVVDGESDDFAPITERLGFDATRIALREDGNTVHVYYQRFREDAHIGHVPITF